MRIGHVAAGAGGMYCGACIRDSTVASTLIEMGHEVALMPTYTPIRTDGPDVSLDRIFYGALSVFLREQGPLFQKIPSGLDRFLSRPGLLKFVAKLGASTDARKLGGMTLSVLEGESGRQTQQLDELVDWLEEYRPDIVYLTNSMFLGLARELKRRLGVPVVCGLAGEDLFIDDLHEPFRTRVKDELGRRAQDADGFVSNSLFYADHMAEYLSIPRDRIHLVPLGIDTEGMAPAQRAAGEPLTIGYFARICPEKGLHLLIEAFAAAVKGRPEAERPRLHVAGYVAKKDEAYVAEQRRRADDLGVGSLVQIDGEVDREGKLAFFRGIDILSVPTVYREPKGLFLLEALAHGVPVVQPRHGAFPELLESTGGGILVEPDSPEALAKGLTRLLDDDELRAELGERGRQAVTDRHHRRAMAERTLEVYKSVIGERQKT